jgi:hypothetical protein
MIVQVERCVNEVLSSYVHGRERIGVLVGRMTPKKGFVLYFVPTPDVEENLDDVKCGLPYEDWWVEDHAHQVREMLPGGLSVVGLCLVSPAFELTTAASLTKLASRFSKPYIESAWSAFLTMHFSTITGSFTCQCRSVPHNVGLPVEVVVDELRDLWCCLESRVSVRLNKLVQPGKPFGDVQQELIAGLNCWSLGTVVFGNKYGGCEGCVADQVKGRYARCVVYPAHQPLEYGQSETLELASAITLHGKFSVIAYVPLEASLAEASKAVTDDVLQTVVIRWEKMCDDMKLEKRQAIGSWQLPRRVELAVDRCMFRFSSYMFSDENETDVCERVGELLGVSMDRVSVMDTEQNFMDVKQQTPRKKGPWSQVFTFFVTLLLVIIFVIYLVMK